MLLCSRTRNTAYLHRYEASKQCIVSICVYLLAQNYFFFPRPAATSILGPRKMSEWNLKLGDSTRALSDAEDALEIYQLLQSSQEVKAWCNERVG